MLVDVPVGLSVIAQLLSRYFVVFRGTGQRHYSSRAAGDLPRASEFTCCSCPVCEASVSWIVEKPSRSILFDLDLGAAHLKYYEPHDVGH